MRFGLRLPVDTVRQPAGPGRGPRSVTHLPDRNVPRATDGPLRADIRGPTAGMGRNLPHQAGRRTATPGTTPQLAVVPPRAQ